VLPARNASDATGFDPIFKPYAQDPPRSLPSVLRAGVMVTPIPTPPLQEYAQLSDPRDASLSSATPSSDERGITRTTLGAIIGAVSIVLLLCLLCGILLVLFLQHPQGESLWTAPLPQGSGSTSSILKNSRLWKANPLAHTTDVSSVRPEQIQELYVCAVHVGVELDKSFCFLPAYTAALRTALLTARSCSEPVCCRCF
jgi:hypothetical protein